MTLPYAKRKLLSGIFTGEDLHRSLTFELNRTQKEKDIRIINAEHTSEYDPGKGVWISKIDLHIENFSDTRWNTEYITYLDLPDGCWISDYYLFVGDVQEPGILAERKAATWVFDRIRERHLDPGLLRYVGGNTVEFKVFPFEQGEVRRTGIEFIHIDPVDIRIDDYTIRLGEESHAVYEYAPAFLSQDDALVYLSTYEKAQLQTGTPEPYFHFIVDVSKHTNIPANDKVVTEELMRKYEQYIGNVLENSPFTAGKYQVTYANSTYYTEQYSINEQVSLSLKKLPGHMKPLEQGFFLQRAIEALLVENYLEAANYYPVIMVISDQPEKSVLTHNFDDLRFTYPFIDRFYFVRETHYFSAPLFGEWDKNLYKQLRNFANPQASYQTSSYRVLQAEDKEWYIPESLRDFRLPEVKVKSYGKHFVPDNGLPSLVLNRDMSVIPDFKTEEITAKTSQSALAIQERRMLETLNPRLGEEEWLDMLRASFTSRLLTPATAYIVVETEAQRQLLAEKQKQVMSGHRDLDLGREWFPMSEPDLFLLLLLLPLLCFLFRKYSG